MPEDPNGYLTRREAELLVESTAAAAAERLATHRREQDAHDVTHDKAHEAHEEKHKGENEAIKTALSAVARERDIHAAAHEKEHEGHQRMHGLNNLAIDKAEQATDKRFISSNGWREQLDGMVRQTATKESIESHVKEIDRRFEDVRLSLRALETTDVKAEGKGLGQSAVIAYIVAGVSILGSLVVLMNLVTPR